MWGCVRFAAISISRTNRSGPSVAARLGPQHFHGHLALVLQVLGEVDRRHTAGAEFPLDFVAVGEGGREAGVDLGHGWLR